MKRIVSKIYLDHLSVWTKDRLISFFNGILLFIVALFIERYADNYVSGLTGPSVDDLLLSHLPHLDIDSMIILGTILLSVITILLIIAKPKYLNFTLKTLSLFIIIRSFFISLTHLGVNPQEIQFDASSIGYGLYNVIFNTKGDFFFSAHVGIPFLMSLIFWKERYWRYFLLIASLIMAFFVLVARLHYSIDVFAAPFMAYGIYSISKWLFKKDFESTI